MSSAVVSTSAASGRLFVFDEEPGAPTRPSSAATKKPAAPDSRGESVLAQVLQATIKNQQSAISITPASQLAVRPAPEMASSGIAALDALTGGLPRGCLTEIFGPASSGRTTVLLAALAAATRREEFCALVDASDALDPQSAATSGVDLDRLLWVRCGANPPRRHGVTVKSENENPGCPTLLSRSVRKRVGSSAQPTLNSGQATSRSSEHRIEQVLRVTDLLLESGGFGLIVLDLADLPPEAARRIPLTTWFRFRRAVEYKSTILLVIEQQPIAGSCSSLVLQLGSQEHQEEMGSCPSHACLFTGLNIHAEFVQSRLNHNTGRKPARSAVFETRTAWAR